MPWMILHGITLFEKLNIWGKQYNVTNLFEVNLPSDGAGTWVKLCDI